MIHSLSGSAKARALSLVIILSLAATVPFASAADAPTFTLIAASAFLRDAPSPQAPATYSIFQGQAYPIIGRSADRTWLQLEIFKATKGTWVLASLGKVTGDLNSVPITAGTGQAGSAATPATSPPVASPVAEPTPTLTSAGPSEICVLLYNDANGNGRLDANEGAIAGGQLTILDTGTAAVVGAYTTTAADTQGHCFTDLAPGMYTIAAAAPAGYNATVASSSPQQVLGGQRYQVYFGAQPRAGTSPPRGNYMLSAVAVVVFLLIAAIAAAILLRGR